MGTTASCQRRVVLGDGLLEALYCFFILRWGLEISVLPGRLVACSPPGSLASGHAWVTWGIWQIKSNPFAVWLQSGFPVSDFMVTPMSHSALILLQRGEAKLVPVRIISTLGLRILQSLEDRELN